MYFQINGRTIRMSVEEYLELTDLDIQYLVSTGGGEVLANPFYGSTISGKGRKTRQITNELDYEPENEQLKEPPRRLEDIQEEIWEEDPEELPE